MKTLIIDVSYLIYKSYFAYPNLTHGDQPIGSFFGFAKTIVQLVKEFQPTELVFALDTPKKTWRHIEKTDYKAGRSEIEQAMVSQIPIIQNWCRKVSQNYFAVEGYEADDVIFTIALENLTNYKTIAKSVDIKIQPGLEEDLFIETKTNQIVHFPLELDKVLKTALGNQNTTIVFSNDRDLYQMLSLPNLTFVNSSKFGNEIFGKRDFETKYQLDPFQWLDYKALAGDPGDNLKGVDGVGPKTATAILQEVHSLYHFYKSLSLDPAPFLRTAGNILVDQAKIQEFIDNPKNKNLVEKLKLNYMAVVETYRLSALVVVPQVEIKILGHSLEKGLDEFEKFGFKSLVTMVKNMTPKASDAEALF